MQQYKSLILVAMMGGVTLCVAGVMTTFEKAALKQREEGSEGLLPPPHSIRLPVAGERPEGQLEADLTVMRETFNRTERPPADRMEKARRHLNRAAGLLGPDDWPVIRAELERKPLHPGYRTMLVVLAGTCANPSALPVIAAHWGEYPTKVAEALRRNGSAAALGVASGLFDGAESPARRLLLLRTMRSFPEDGARSFLLRVLAGPHDESVLKQALTMLRHYRHPDVVSALEAFVRGCDASRMALAKRALNSMTGLQLESAAASVLSMYLDEELGRAHRDAAGEALAFARAPFLVERVIELLGGGADAPALISFLNRNAGPEHGPALTAAVESLPPGEVREALATVLSRLEP